jgi:hypothetical protein
MTSDPKRQAQRRRSVRDDKLRSGTDKRFTGAKVTTADDLRSDTYRVRRLPEPPAP